MKKVSVVYQHMPHYRQGFLNELSNSPYKVEIVTGQEDVIEGIHSARIPENFDHIKLKNLWFGKLLWQLGLVTHAAKSDSDAFVFLASPNFLSTWIAAVVARVRGKRVIFWGHGFLKPEQRLKNLFRKVFFGISHAFYSYGYGSRDIAVKFGFDRASLYVGLNSLDVVAQKKIRAQIVSDEGKESEGQLFTSAGDVTVSKILCVSRLNVQSAYHLLIDALALLSKVERGYKYELVIIGDGPTRSELELQAERLGVRAKFLGAIYDEAIVARWFYQADMTVSPGKIGLTAMHSLAYGTPVVSHSNISQQMPEIEALVEGRTGAYFICGDSADLARVLFEFKSRFRDRDVVRRNCIRIIEEYYNPNYQVKVLADAIEGRPSLETQDVRSIQW